MLLETFILLSTPHFLRVCLHLFKPPVPLSLISVQRHVAKPGEPCSCASILTAGSESGSSLPLSFNLPSPRWALAGCPPRELKAYVSLNGRRPGESLNLYHSRCYMFYCANAAGLAAASHRERHHCSDLLLPLKTVIIIQDHTHTHSHQYPFWALAPRHTEAAWCCCVELFSVRPISGKTVMFNAYKLKHSLALNTTSN